MRLRSRSSPRSISRLASSPTTRKKKVIRPSLTQCRRSIVMWALPRLIESLVVQTDSYECDQGEFAHRSAAIVAASSTAALPVSVVRKSRTGAAWTAPGGRRVYDHDWDGLTAGSYADVSFAERDQDGVDLPYTWHVDRGKFDLMLLKHASNLGADVYCGVSVQDVDMSDATRPKVYVSLGGRRVK